MSLTIGTDGNWKSIIASPSSDCLLMITLPSSTATWEEMIREAGSPPTLYQYQRSIYTVDTCKVTQTSLMNWEVETSEVLQTIYWLLPLALTVDLNAT